MARLGWQNGGGGTEWSYDCYYSYSALNGRQDGRIIPQTFTPPANAVPEAYLLGGIIGYIVVTQQMRSLTPKRPSAATQRIRE